MMPHPLFHHPISDSNQPDDKDENEHQWSEGATLTETMTGKHLQDVNYVPCARMEGEGQTDVWQSLCVCVCAAIFYVMNERITLCEQQKEKKKMLRGRRGRLTSTLSRDVERLSLARRTPPGDESVASVPDGGESCESWATASSG